MPPPLPPDAPRLARAGHGYRYSIMDGHAACGPQMSLSEANFGRWFQFVSFFSIALCTC